MRNLPRISFGIIVLNGEPFMRYNLRGLYPFAHQIIVAEGAGPKAAHAATPDGHSIDGTLDVLRRFKAEEDPEDKVLIVTSEDEGNPNGFWLGAKDEQSQAYAKRATGDWLWQIDIDEFYQPQDMQRVCDYLLTHPASTCLTFNAHHFWGGFDYLVEGGLFMSYGFQCAPWGAYRRLFKWGPGYRYVTHEPPCVLNASGREITHVKCNITRALGPNGPRLYHYFMVFPEPVFRKSRLYDNMGWRHETEAAGNPQFSNEERQRRLFAQLTDRDRFRIFTHHGTHNWLRRFTGSHPPTIAQLINDLQNSRRPCAMRRTDDIERILRTPGYQRRTAWLWYWELGKQTVALAVRLSKKQIKRLLRMPVGSC